MKATLFSQRFFLIFLGGLFLVELAFQTFWKARLGVYWQPVIYIMLMAGYYFSSIHFSTLNRQDHSFKAQRWLSLGMTGVVLLVNLLLFYAVGNKIAGLFSEIAIDPLNSDVMPAIQLYVQRILAGEWAYAPMKFPGWTVIPNYLPMVWLPFVVPEILDIDYRWLPFGVFIIYSLYYWLKNWQNDSLHSIEYGIKSILPATILWLLARHEPMIFAHTAEIMIAVFYLILCETVLSKKPWMAAVGIALCLLSRYSFGFWLPFYLMVYWHTFGWKMLLQVGGYLALAVFVVYVFPFLFEDPFVYQKGMAYYMSSAEGEWVRHGWQEAGERPYHLGRGFGFAVFVYDFINGDVPFKLKIIQILNLSTALFITGLLLAGYWWLKEKMTSRKLYMIIALKVYIMVFYSFIHVPYAYLFVLPLLLTLPILLRINFRQIWGTQ